MRLSEIRVSHEENNKLKEELATLRVKMQDYEEEILSLKMKVKEVKKRKNEKISKLKSECDTLKIVHNRLVELLDQQCEENNRMLNDQVRYSSPEQARLLQEEDYRPVVTLLNREGKVRGHVLKSANGREYYAYQEVPYAAPPVGNNRFKPLKSHSYWNGILDCTKNTKVCMQDLESTDLNVTEDCLYLNIYSPVKPEDSYYTQFPVLIWVHGGGFKSGSGIFQNYNPKYFMDHDIVVVTINYRLGPFGFLTLQDDNLPANLGVADIGYAMRWVFDNISPFGGDRYSATLVGTGAGAASTGYVSTGPKIKAQIASMIQQSGTPISDLYYQSNPKEYALELGKLIDEDFNSTNSTDLLKLLLETSSSKIMKANRKLEEIYGNKLIWGPVYDENEDPDDDSSYCPAPPLETFKSGTWIYYSMFGFNSEEAIALASSTEELEELARQYDENPLLLVNDLWNVDEANRSVVAEQIKAAYTDRLFSEDLAAFIKYKSDSTIRLPMLKQADLARYYSIPFLYEFAYKGNLGQRFEQIEGTDAVGHGEEVNYLWDDGTHPDWDEMDENDKLMINRMVKLWVNYVTYSDPMPEDDELFGNITWPSNSRYDNITYLVINSTLELKVNPSRYEEVRQIIDEYSNWPLSVF